MITFFSVISREVMFLSRCNTVAVMKSDSGDDESVGTGRISEMGKYEDLMRNEGEFSTLMKKSGEDVAQTKDNVEGAAVTSNKGRPSRGESLGTMLKNKGKESKKLMQKEEKMSG